MSALAARRAAAAAKASGSVDVTPAITPQVSTPAASSSKPKAQASKPVTTQPSPSPSSPRSLSLPSSGESDTEVIIASSAKRRRIEKSPPKQQRYFAHSSSSATKPRNGSKKPERAFSPSAPAEEEDEDDDIESQASSSSGSRSSDLDVADEAEMKVDEGSMRWGDTLSAPATPAPRIALRNTIMAGRHDVGTSRFDPVEGVNWVKMSEKELRNAGLVGKGAGVIVSLGIQDTLMIAGTYSLAPLQQSVRLLSTTLQSDGSSHPVFAPTSHPIPVIQAAPALGAQSRTGLQSLRLPKTFQLVDGKQPRTVFLIREQPSGLEGLRGGAVPGFTNAFLEGKGLWGLSGVHPIIGSFSTPVYPYHEPSSWSSALESLAPPTDTDDVAAPVVLVKGPKRTGKSTMARAGLNGLLQHYAQVAWLECDLGQGEFGCGGMVGIWILDSPVLGPPFTHPRTPARAHYLGTYTPLTCPDEYIAAIRHLLEYHKYEVQYPTATSTDAGSRRTDIIPLVINTQGWVKGLGEDLLRGIEAASAPTHVFAFEHSSLPDEDFHPQSPSFNPALLPPEQGGPAEPANLFVLDPAPVSPLQARYTSADMRILSMITYLHGSRGTSHPAWDVSMPLGAIPPIEVRLGNSAPMREVYLIGEGADNIDEDDLELALNGSIVALGRNETPSQDVYIAGRTLPSLDDMNVFGLALVRGIRRDDSGWTLQLLTPLPGRVLATVNCLVKNGAIELPTCGLLDWRGEGEKGEKVFGVAVESGEVPFLEKMGGAAGYGMERKKVRRNLQRRNN